MDLRIEQPEGDAKLVGLVLIAMLQRFGPQAFSAIEMEGAFDAIMECRIDEMMSLHLSIIRRTNPS